MSGITSISNASYLDSLSRIADFDLTTKEDAPCLSVAKVRQNTFSVSTAALPIPDGFFPRVWQAFLQAIGKLPKLDIDDLKDLRKLYKAVLKLDIPIEERTKYAMLVERSLENLKKIYEAYRNNTSIEAMSYKNDILEAVAIAVKRGGLNDRFNLDIERVAADPIKPFTGKIEEHHIPIFRMQDVTTVAALMSKKFQDRVPTLQELHEDEDLCKYLIIEHIPMASIVNWMYKHSWIGKILNNDLCTCIMTKLAGWLNKRELKPGKDRTITILQFFKKLGIRPETAIRGELYSYREMFKNHLRNESSCDGAFQRALNKRGLQMLMKSAKGATKAFEKRTAFNPRFNALPVISNAFCRLRMIDIPPNSVKAGFTIEGKQLNATSPGACTLQNMFGNENDIDTSFSKETPLVKPQSRRQAEYIYRCCLTNAVNRKKMTMIIQRLAPEDVHHFVESVGGRVLGHSEACTKLLQLLECTENPQERDQLQELRVFFSEHPTGEGVVKVRGTRMSVSTLATRYQSPLSQNDRKIMMVEHPDGSISIHIFIGAAGVNNVRITAGSGELERGGPIGSMGFGDDEQERDNWDNMATKKESIRLRSNPQEVATLGEERGEFSKEGSTVVSLYTNFQPSFAMSTAESTLQYRDPQGVVRHIEIQAQMGDIIGKIV